MSPNPNHEGDLTEADEEFREKMTDIAINLDNFLNGDEGEKEIGFLLMVFPFADDTEATKRTSYISNAERGVLIHKLRENLEHLERVNDMMRREEERAKDGNSKPH